MGGNEERGGGAGAREREAENKGTENHTEENSEGSDTYKITRWGEKMPVASPLVLAFSFLFFFFSFSPFKTVTLS